MSDLEDDMPQADLQEELFGGGLSDEEEAPAPTPPARKKLRQIGAAPDTAAVPAAEATPAPVDRRKLLQQLAASKKREADEQEQGARAKKKQKSSKGSKASRDGKDGSKASGRSSRQSAHDELFGGDEGEEEEEKGPEGPVPDMDVPVAETDADRAFIDDDGLAPEEVYESDGDDPDQRQVDEAEEVAPGQEGDYEGGEAEEGGIEAALAARKRRRNRESEVDQQQAVDDLIALMEVAAEEDRMCFEQKRPAMHKLKHLKTVEETLLQRKYHELFIQSGGLKAANSWLEPYRDGTLPNAKVRQTLLRLLDEIRLDTSMEYEKDQLMKSGLGRTVMFMYHNPDEGAATRKIAKALVERWVRPITYDAEREAAKQASKQQMLQAARTDARKRAALKDGAAAKEAAATAALRPGQPGYRLHARLPPQATLDFVVNPQVSSTLTDSSSPANPRGAAPSKTNSRLDKTWREAQRKHKSAFSSAAKVSVEGRGVGSYL